MVEEIVGGRWGWHDGTLFFFALAAKLFLLLLLLEKGLFGADLTDVAVAFEVVLLAWRALHEEVLAETFGARVPCLSWFGSGDPAFLVAVLGKAASWCIR